MGRSLIDYTEFSGLADIYLEDSYVLEILEEPGKLTFKLDAVLTPEDPAYQPPRPGEQYCYRTGRLVFTDAVCSLGLSGRVGSSPTPQESTT